MFRVPAISSRLLRSLASQAPPLLARRQYFVAQLSRPRSAPALRCTTPHGRRAPYHSGHFGAHSFRVKESGSGLTTFVVVFGIALGGALLFPLFKSDSPTRSPVSQATPNATFTFEDYEDSYLVMPPNMPAGRPGTLTPEQEVKLREFWAVTMKVFGVYEAPSVEHNGAETPSAPSIAETGEKDGKKEKEKKKSRLHVFKRKDKHGKETDAESAPASGTATPTDISQLSIADGDDKHGQTKEFKDAIANISPEDLRTAFWGMVKHDHPDGLLLRFLRARKWDVEKALVMMISTMSWRLKEMHVDDDIIINGELAALEQTKSDDPKIKKEAEDFLAQLRMGKSFLHGVDKEGRPMCYVRVRLHKQGEQSEESIERFTVWEIETARMLLRPPVDTATIVFDMTNFSMANMDYAPVKFMIKCFEANYPESLGAVLVYKAPWIFNTIWAIIRGWLDPVVAGKVHFVKTPEDLEEFVPRSQIITELGGDEKWEYSYVEAVPGENDQMKDEAAKAPLLAARKEIVDRYESTVLNWIHEPEKESLETRRKERDVLAEELRANYWKLDPYVRAKTLYDRIGMIQPGGKLDFYGKNKENVAPAPVQTTEDDLD